MSWNADFYRSLLAKHGNSSRALDWSPRGQSARFDAIRAFCGQFSSECSVVDVGCGLGHLAISFAPERYLGIDTLPEMIAEAKRINPAHRFALATGAIPHADLIVASGVCNLDRSVAITTFLQDCWNACRKGIAVNALSVHAETRIGGRVYRDPADLIPFISRLSTKWVIRHDYLPNDFQIEVYR